MLKEDAGSAWHGQKISISSEGVFLDRILCCIGALLCVVVLYESYSPLAVAAALIVIADEWPVAIVLLPQSSPVSIISSIANSIT